MVRVEMSLWWGGLCGLVLGRKHMHSFWVVRGRSETVKG